MRVPAWHRHLTRSMRDDIVRAVMTRIETISQGGAVNPPERPGELYRLRQLLELFTKDNK